MSEKEGVIKNSPSPPINEDGQASGTLGEAEELYRNMVELSPDSMVTVDTKGVIISCNAMTLKMLGYTRDEMVGKHFTKLGTIRLKDVPKYLKLFRSVLAGKVAEPYELAFTHKDGTILIVDARVNLLKVGGKTVIQTTSRDVTERKRMEQELQKKNEQLDAQNEELRASEEELRASNEELRATEEELRAANEELQAANEELREAQEQLVRSERLAAIGQLAGGVGHELRNPLGAIKNAAYYIRGKAAKSELAESEPRVLQFLDIIDEEIESSNKIINDLLGFSRVGKPAVSPARLERVVEDALSHSSIPENIEVVKKTDASLPEIEIDTDQVRQVFVNLISNAVHAMPEGGALTIVAAGKDKFVEVSVSDAGSGISKEILNKIFDPLFTTKAKGIGLGLAVTKTIIDRHEGQIKVESEEGKGTTFTVRLPVKAG